MNTPKHTPGPWKVSDTSIVTADDRHCIAVIEDDGGYEAPSEQREANARLIAAAPELLDACKAVANDGPIKALSGQDHITIVMTGDQWTALLAAIAKAEGAANE